MPNIFKKLVTSVILVALTAWTAFGQGTVSGIIRDKSGEPVPGAVVTLKGTSRGAMADMQGRYSITAGKGDVLEFSCLGYRTESVTVSKTEGLNIVLTEDNTSLEESVVIGYGVQDRRRHHRGPQDLQRLPFAPGPGTRSHPHVH